MPNFIPQHAVVWAEIPVTDMARATAFYAAVLQNEPADEEGGPNPMSRLAAQSQSSIAGHLYPGKPATPGTGNTVHLAVAKPLAEAMERVTAGGGQVVSPIIEIPAGRFAYCLDPDGNSIGLFEA